MTASLMLRNRLQEAGGHTSIKVFNMTSIADQYFFMKASFRSLAALLSLLMAAGLARAQMPGAAGHHHHHGQAMQAQPDARKPVQFPPLLRQQMLGNMRAHLVALRDIQEALGGGDFQKAAQIAESSLGMSSLRDHHADENAKYMPAPMAQLGSAMHRAASQFALAAQDASASGDFKKPLAALAKLSASCVACHAAYRLH